MTQNVIDSYFQLEAVTNYNQLVIFPSQHLLLKRFHLSIHILDFLDTNYKLQKIKIYSTCGLKMEDDKKETAKIISSTSANSNGGGGGDDLTGNEGDGSDDVAMNEGDTSSDSSFSVLLKKRKLKGPETTSESPSKKTKLNGGQVHRLNIFDCVFLQNGELIKYMVLDLIVLQDMVNTACQLSKASHRRSVCITSAGGSVSTLDLRTPNVPFTRQVHTQIKGLNLNACGLNG